MFSFGVLPIADIQALSYDDKQNMESIYGSGSEPIGYGLGRSDYSASVTLLIEGVLTLLSQAPNGKLSQILPFDFICLFQPEGSTTVQTITLKNCKFMQNKISFKEGDLSISQEIPLLISGVEIS